MSENENGKFCCMSCGRCDGSHADDCRMAEKQTIEGLGLSALDLSRHA